MELINFTKISFFLIRNNIIDNFFNVYKISCLRISVYYFFLLANKLKHFYNYTLKAGFIITFHMKEHGLYIFLYI